MHRHSEYQSHLTKKRTEVINNQQFILLQPPQIAARDGRYVAYKNGIVCDCYTNTEWYPGPNTNTSWIEADRWVRRLSICGGGWSLATLEQLKNLYCKNKNKDKITPLLILEATDVWSCEIRDKSSAWGFNFIPGNVFWTYCTYSNRFRALATRKKPRYRSVSRIFEQKEKEYQVGNN